MKLSDIHEQYKDKYQNGCYDNDPGIANLFKLLDNAEKLSPAAQREFVQAFNFEFALDNQMYLGSKPVSEVRYPI